MELALIIPFALILVAPFIGRWRANVWLKKNMPARTAIEADTVAKTA